MDLASFEPTTSSMSIIKSCSAPSGLIRGNNGIWKLSLRLIIMPLVMAIICSLFPETVGANTGTVTPYSEGVITPVF